MRERILRQPGGMGVSLRSKSRRHVFHPSFVPEIAAGYWWDTSAAVGFGTAGFKVPEGGGHTSFDLIQATVANQPTLLTEQGGQQFRMRKTGDATGASKLGTSTFVQRGWTGPTYIGGWFRLPDNSGSLAAAGSFFFVHSIFTGNQFAVQLSGLLTGGNQRVRVVTSTNGSAAQNAQWANPFTGNFIWIEALITAAATIELDVNFAPQTRLDANGLFPLFDPTAARVSIGSNVDGNVANADTTDWCFATYGNGIPSLANRVKTANFRNPTGVLLTA